MYITTHNNGNFVFSNHRAENKQMGYFVVPYNKDPLALTIITYDERRLKDCKERGKHNKCAKFFVVTVFLQFLFSLTCISNVEKHANLHETAWVESILIYLFGHKAFM